jgi:hypothetical protein
MHSQAVAWERDERTRGAESLMVFQRLATFLKPFLRGRSENFRVS